MTEIKPEASPRWPPLPRRGLRRTEAAAYIGVGPTKFDELVADRRMPKPKHIDGRRVWDIRELDAAFDDLPGGEEGRRKSYFDGIEGPKPLDRMIR